jgi:hypothetical protein
MKAVSTANWEVIHEAAQKAAQELFQPVLLDLDTGVPADRVVAQLVERLRDFGR